MGALRRRASAGAARTRSTSPRRAAAEDFLNPDPVAVGGGGSSVRWSFGAVLGRQLSQLIAALVIARILGPQTYGIISAATIYVTFTTLLLDQGLAAALIQRPVLSRRLPGAVATANLITSVVLAAGTFLAAPAVAAFFSAPPLEGLLRVLGAGLLLKGLAVTPRAIQSRMLAFKNIAIADISGGFLGAAVGVAAALLGANVWSMAIQVLTTDLVIAAVLIAVTRGTAPNLALRELGAILPFSLRIFGSNALAFCSRNFDNVLVGRFLGVGALSLYSMAYRVLVIPVQMIGQTVNRVTFPTFARLADQRDRLAAALLKVTELLAFAAVLPMVLVAVAAPELVEIVLGAAWAATAPVLTVLAVAGARETVFNVTGSLMRACGEGKLIFRYEIAATALQLIGIITGLWFGLLGVAVGLTAAGFVLTPVLLLIQRRLCGLSIRRQLARVTAPVHVSLWGTGAYLLVRQFGWSDLVTVLIGTLAYALLALAVLLLVHRAALRRVLAAAHEIVTSRSGGKVEA